MHTRCLKWFIIRLAKRYSVCARVCIIYVTTVIVDCINLMHIINKKNANETSKFSSRFCTNENSADEKRICK